MRLKPIDLIVLLALIAGMTYFAAHKLGLDGAWSPALKGSCVALLAVWAAMQARNTDGYLIAGALALGAAGDVLLETSGLITGALAFLAGHIAAIALYLRNRRRELWRAAGIAIAVAVAAWWLPLARGMAPGIALYGLGLGGMAGTALISRFAKDNVGMGAILFVASDLLIFAQIGPLHGSPLPGYLIWPLYVAAQASIAWGVVTVLRSEQP
jgi:uncharacterized membrane protein YhhN